MARSVRSKKPLTKYPEDEYVMDSKPKKDRAKKSTELVEAAKNRRVKATVTSDNVGGSTRAKGNLQIDSRPLKAIRKPVLRDRTNLPGERLKVDLLMKQGTIDEAAKKPARSMKKIDDPGTLTSSAKTPTRSIRPRKKIDNVEAERPSSSGSSRDSKKISEEDEPEVENGGKVVKRLSSRKTLKRSKEIRDIPKKVSSQKDKEEITSSSGSSGVHAERKFFKTKAIIGMNEPKKSPIKTTVFGKRRNIGAREKARASVSFRSRQTTLNESFAKQMTKKVLRPRKTTKNYCEDSRILTKGETENAVKTVESRKAGPIYKTVKLQDDSPRSKKDIFDFPYDSNDSREKLRKKTRKRIVTKKGKATGSGPKKIAKTAEAANSEKKPKPEVVERVSTESNKLPEPISSVQNGPMEIDEIQTDPKDPQGREEASKVVEKRNSLPRIVENVELKENERVSLTTTPQLGKTSEANRRPLHSKNLNRPSLQFRTMMNHALLSKSISPIVKAVENFDPGSPWRPPIITNQQFSRVRNIVQSTPQIKKFSAIIDKTENIARVEKVEKIARTEKIEIIARMKYPTKVDKISRKDENSVQILDESSPKKAIVLAKSPRKFGTVISNVNAVEPIVKRLNNDDENRISPTKMPFQARDVSENTISYDIPEVTNNFHDDVDDKENSVPSPKKSPLKSLNRSPLKSLNRNPLTSLNKSPLKSLNKSPLTSLNKSPLKSPMQLPSTSGETLKKLSTMSKENMECQPGTSKMEKTNDDSRFLRQSNLDNFLNLDEMPKSTKIITAHGIFDDAHSTPISGKPLRRMTKNVDVANAFGFDDIDESEMEISPITRPPLIERKMPKQAPTVQKNVQAKKGPAAPARLLVDEIKNIVAPARLSIGDIKKFLSPTRKKNKVSDDPIVERIEEEINEDQADGKEKLAKKNKKIVDPASTEVNDLEAEKAATDDENVKEVSLFGDLEPVHFKHAPRYSYKRKRAPGFIFSDNEQDDEEIGPVSPENHATKKRKVSKVERERQRQMEDWAKSLNETFEEIDHFDLVVE